MATLKAVEHRRREKEQRKRDRKLEPRADAPQSVADYLRSRG
jgi:hypothetical protein